MVGVGVGCCFFGHGGRGGRDARAWAGGGGGRWAAVEMRHDKPGGGGGRDRPGDMSGGLLAGWRA